MLEGASPIYSVAKSRIRVESEEDTDVAVDAASLSCITIDSTHPSIYVSDALSAKKTNLLRLANITYVLNCTVEIHTFTGVNENEKDNQELHLRIFDSRTEAILDINYMRVSSATSISPSIVSRSYTPPPPGYFFHFKVSPLRLGESKNSGIRILGLESGSESWS